MKEKFRNTVKMYRRNDILIPDFEIEYAKLIGLNEDEINSIITEIYGENINPRKTDIQIFGVSEDDIVNDELNLYRRFDIYDYIEIVGNDAYVFNIPLRGDGWFTTPEESFKDTTLDDFITQNPNLNIIDKRDGREFKHKRIGEIS